MSRRLRLRRLVAVVCAVATVAFGVVRESAAQRPTDDDTRLRARTLGEEGNSLFDSGDFKGALDRYERASKLVSVPTLGLKAARCLVKLGRWVEASERYLAVTRTVLAADALDIHKEAVASAAQERDALLPRIPSLVVRVSGAGPATVTLDGKPYSEALLGVKSPADPGPHHLEARRGNAVATREITLEEGQVSEVELAPLETGHSAPPSQSTTQTNWLSPAHGAGIGVMAVGVVGLAIGAGATAAVAAKKSTLERDCGADLQCRPQFYSAADSYNHLRIVSTVGWIAGGVLTATGIVMIAIPSSTHSAKAQPSVSGYFAPLGAGLVGNF